MTVTPHETYGCEWPLDPACLEDTWEEFDTDVQERAQALAGQTLRRLTAYRVGGCPITVRPSPQHNACFVPVQGSFPAGLNAMGRWVNNCGMTSGGCEVALPPPVGRVDEVLVDGTALDPTEYQIQNGNLLVWMGVGDCPFPASQSMSTPITEPGTMSVTYLNSYEVDSLGAYAGGIMAVEFAKACSGPKCKLPPGVTAVARQGVTFDIISGAFPGGLTGIREVDAFISLWNPDGNRQPTGVWSPDSGHRVVGG